MTFPSCQGGAGRDAKAARTGWSTIATLPPGSPTQARFLMAGAHNNGIDTDPARRYRQ